MVYLTVKVLMKSMILWSIKVALTMVYSMDLVYSKDSMGISIMEPGHTIKNTVSEPISMGMGMNTEVFIISSLGYFKNNEFHGRGTLHLNGGGYCKGNFVEGLLHGEGVIIAPDGKKKEGLIHPTKIGCFTNGRLNGYGEEVFSDGTALRGEF